MKNARVMCVSAFSAVCFGVVTAGADILVNGNFESMPNFGAGVSGDAGYSALTGNQIPGWTIEAGHAVTVHNTALYPTISGNYSVNMDGEGYNGVNANMYQDFASTNGDWYTLEFDWARWATDGLTMLHVSVTDLTTNTTLVSGSYLSGVGVQHAVLPFVATGNMLRLRVEESPESGFNDNRFIVDNFTLVPTPGAACVVGLGGVAILRRRR